MKKIRWGVLSTAKIAQTQLIPAIQRSKNAELVGIASESEKVNEIATLFDIPKVYENYEAMLQDPSIDVVYIPLPNHLHKEWVMKAAEYGKHILCEKPAALTADESREMVQYCKEKNVKFMEAFMYQFHPQHERVHQIIEQGEIGEVKLLKSGYSFLLEDRNTNIRMNKHKGGGSIYDIGCYSIHTFRRLLKSEPLEAFVQAEVDPIAQVDVTTTGFLTFANGVRAIFDCSYNMTRQNSYEIIGTKGTIQVPYAYRPDSMNGNVGIITITTDGVTRTEKITGDAFASEVEHLSSAILNDQALIQTGEDTIQNMRVIDACYESIKTGKVVNIEN